MVLKKIGKTSLLFILPILLLTGCSNNKDTVATMKGYTLNSEDFLKELNLSRTAYQMSSTTELSDEDIRSMANDTIKHLTLLEAFCKEGEKLNLNPSEEELENLFKKAKEQTGFQEILDSSNYSDEYLKENLYKTETAYAYYLHLYDSIAISTSDAREFFEENKDSLYTSETADAAHILFKTFSKNEDGTTTPLSDEEKANVKKKAEEVLSKVEAGEDFNELAKQYSEDEGSKEDGGELGTFGRNQMVKEFEVAAFGLEEGKTSKLVETEYGYHIIKLNKKSVSVYDFEDIASYVKQDLLDSLFLKEVNKIEEKYNIKTNNDTINELLNNLKPISLPSDSDSEEDTKTEDTTEENKETSNDSTDEDADKSNKENSSKENN